jgi:hypothetical protein
MLNIMLPKHILNWVIENKGKLSMPVYVIHCIAYIKDNNINLEELHHERGENDRTKRFNRKREGKHIDTV